MPFSRSPAAVRRLAPAALAAVAACGVAPASRPLAPAPRPAAASAQRAMPASAPAHVRAPAAAHDWSGTYDLVATGFPDGERDAVMTVARGDTGHALTSLAGPPGRLLLARFAGDSAHLLWELGAGETARQIMSVGMRAAGDSLSGRWAVGERQGLVHGRRRR
jgi:hypothetical protein